MRIFVAIVDVQKRKNVRGTFLFISAHRILFRRCARAKSHVRGWHYRMTGRTPEPNQISDGGEKKLRAIFTSLEGQEGPPLAFRPLVPYQIPRGEGSAFSVPFPSRPFSPSICPSLSVSRIISFESTIMGRREHAGHVFAKVCAPNTKAAPGKQDQYHARTSQEEDDGRGGMSWPCDIPACPLVGRQIVSFSLAFLSQAGQQDNTLSVVKEGRPAEASYGSTS